MQRIIFKSSVQYRKRGESASVVKCKALKSWFQHAAKATPDHVRVSVFLSDRDLPFIQWAFVCPLIFVLDGRFSFSLLWVCDTFWMDSNWHDSIAEQPWNCARKTSFARLLWFIGTGILAYHFVWPHHCVCYVRQYLYSRSLLSHTEASASVCMRSTKRSSKSPCLPWKCIHNHMTDNYRVAQKLQLLLAGGTSRDHCKVEANNESASIPQDEVHKGLKSTSLS